MWISIIYYALCLLLVPVLGSVFGLAGLKLLLPMIKQNGAKQPSPTVINTVRFTTEFLNGLGSALLAILLGRILHQEFSLMTLLILLTKPFIEMLARKSLTALPAHIVGLFSVYGILQLYVAA